MQVLFQVRPTLCPSSRLLLADSTFASGQSLSAGIAAGLQHRFQRMKPSYQVAIRSFHKFVDDKVAASRLKLANGGEVAQPESVVSRALFSPSMLFDLKC